MPIFIKKGVFLLIFVLLAAGCSTRPQYLPEDIKDHPKNKVSILIIDLRLNFLRIDETVVKNKETLLRPKPIFLSPGKHNIDYNVYGVADEWRDFFRSMIKSGYTLSTNGKVFFKDINGVKIKKSALPSERYGWNSRKKEITVESGKRYKISDF